jgi:hypothetical protein
MKFEMKRKKRRKKMISIKTVKWFIIEPVCIKDSIISSLLCHSIS